MQEKERQAAQPVKPQQREESHSSDEFSSDGSGSSSSDGSEDFDFE